MISPRKPYRDSVFINCPFDGEYLPIFRAIVFTVSVCGCVPRCSLEHDDGSQVRLEKIYRLIGSSAFGIHDISRTELVPAHLTFRDLYELASNGFPSIAEAVSLNPLPSSPGDGQPNSKPGLPRCSGLSRHNMATPEAEPGQQEA